MKKGFTLIELMIVIAIVGILAAVAIPKIQLVMKNHERAKKGLSPLKEWPTPTPTPEATPFQSVQNYCPYCGHKLP